MATKKTSTAATASTDGFQRGGAGRDETARRRDARRGQEGAKKADGLEAVLTAIAAMADDDRVLAENLHRVVTSTAPQLSPKTSYGMPSYADQDGKVVVFFQDADKFKARYATLGVQDTAHPDDGDLWPTSFALKKWSPEVEKQVAALVQSAFS